MSWAESPLLSLDDLSILHRLPCEPASRSRYYFLLLDGTYCGGLVWPDEFPESGSSEGSGWWWKGRYLIAHRASITLGGGQDEYRPMWEQVARHAPHWPGLRPERRGERARRRLLAALRCEARCLDELDADGASQGSG